jgi:hypothetical protein
MLPWLLVTVSSLLFIYLKFNKSQKSGRKTNYLMMARSIYSFCFKVKSEDRLNAFQRIHLFFPRYARLKLPGFDFIAVYDPELCKKIFNAQSACQRPYRNCMRLEKGLLASECELFLNRWQIKINF